MKWQIKIIDHTADEAIEIFADSTEGLFTAAAYGMKDVLVEPFELEDKAVKKLFLNESTKEELLVKFLDEINFLFQTEKWLFNKVSTIKINADSGGWTITSELEGEIYNARKHVLKHEIKAVTFHQMEIKETSGGFITRIVFDI
jgi:SHS2 domain-containing protein